MNKSKNFGTPINIFVGTDRSQKFAVPVLEYSINKYTDFKVKLQALDNQVASITPPEDIRHGARTGFSFVRFVIPSLTNFKGRAIYLDADMLVFSDIRELWEWDLGDRCIAIIGDTNSTRHRGMFSRRRIRQCSVMLIDCEKCHWDANEIVKKLGKEYSYEQLMYEMCFLEEEKIATSLPYRWNSLEHYDTDTSLIHYTDMHTQPWVDASNPNGYLWVNVVREMIEQGLIELADIEEEIRLGYLRPSLLEEVKLPVQTNPLTKAKVEHYCDMDTTQGYVKHKAVFEERQERLKQLKTIEKNMSLRALFTMMPSRESRHPILRAKYYYYLFTH